MLMKFICETCGEKYSRETYTSTSSKQSKEYWREREGTVFGQCYDCYKKEKEEKKQKAMEEASLPELTGSEKQIEWATKIRFQKYEESRPYMKDGKGLTMKGLETYDRLFGMSEAKFWIDNRDKQFRELMNMVAAMMPAEIETEIKAEEEKESKEKMQVLQPENSIDGTPVEIRVTDAEVSVISKKDEKIIDICKDKGYSWKNGAWRKSISYRTGISIDRAADIANKLLSIGYPVTIDSAEATAKAVSAEFEPECTKWIFTNTNEKYKGWLIINWKERNSDLYNTARSLPRSRYDSPDVIVPIAYFREVEDFAGLYGFKFSPGAQKAIAEYKDSLEVKAVSPEKAPEIEKPKGLKSILENDNNVIDDLKD